MSIKPAAQALRDALDGFEPALFSGADAAELVKELALTEKVCATARVRAANRATECGAHKDEGFTRPSDWLGHQSGQDPSKARRDMDTAQKAEEHAPTRDALSQGDVSLDEAEQVVKSPEDADELLDLARRTHDQRRLREQARQRRQERDRDTIAEKRRQARGIRAWKDDLGMIQVRGALLPEMGVPFLERLKAQAERLWKGGDRHSSPDQRLHDAFFDLSEGRGRASTRTELMAVYDLNAGTFHIPGVGPLDPETAKDVAQDAFVTGVVHDGVEVRHYRRFGKYIPRELQVLLEMGDPPHFEGMRCVDCSATFAFERDHVDPRANGGETSLANIEPRCPPCHRAKTERDREAGLLGPNPKRPPRRKEAKGRPRAGRPNQSRAP